MKAKVNLHFYAKSTKANAKGQFPIYVRLTVNGIRTEFSTKKFIDLSRWLSEAAKMKGTTEEARPSIVLSKNNMVLHFTGKRKRSDVPR